MLRFQEWWIERSRIDNMYALNTIILFRNNDIRIIDFLIPLFV